METIIKAKPNPQLKLNSLILQRELQWFYQVLDTRFKLYFQQETPYTSIYDVPRPNLKQQKSLYGEIIGHYNMSIDERLILLLALAPHIHPQVLDIFFTKNEKFNRGFTEFGGIKGSQHGGFLPTGETAAFVISAGDLTRRFQIYKLFDPDHFFSKHKILSLETGKGNEPLLSSPLRITKEYLSLLTLGESYKPTFSSEFPAQKISTKLDWDDLVLDLNVLDEVQEILGWIKHHNTLMEDWGLQKFVKPGYRSLFYGPPGTGKTLTASLLGKSTDLDVYRVDLSKIVSKYIGETEKNLANIFDQAENKNWVLFFDEADALFGKRSNTSDAKDRYANQEIAYLLQRIEDFPGVIILATNLKGNLDEAFSRRFQSMVYFPMPRPQQRMQLWQNVFENFELDDDVDLWKIAKDHEVAGGAIINILRYCALSAIDRGERTINLEDILSGIRKELKKEGKTM